MQDVLQSPREPSDAPRHRAASKRSPRCRYAAIESGAWIGWRAETEPRIYSRRGGAVVPTRITPALILDFSQSGCLLLADELPALGEPAWLGLTRIKEVPSVEILVVSTESTARGPHLLHVAFKDPCPYPLFKAVVLGSVAIHAETHPVTNRSAPELK